MWRWFSNKNQGGVCVSSPLAVYKHTVRRRKQLLNLVDWAENTFKCTVSNSLYQEAVFKATKNLKSNDLTLPPGGGATASLFAWLLGFLCPHEPEHQDVTLGPGARKLKRLIRLIRRTVRPNAQDFCLLTKKMFLGLFFLRLFTQNVSDFHPPPQIKKQDLCHFNLHLVFSEGGVKEWQSLLMCEMEC